MKIKNKSVTLVELITVVAIVGIVSAVSFSTYSKMSQENRLKKVAGFMRTILDAGRAYELQHPVSISGTRPIYTWTSDWKSYLKNYLAEQHDIKGPTDPILKTDGNNSVEYYIDTTNDLRSIYGFDTASQVRLKLTWQGELTRENPVISPHTHCTTASDCNDHNACTTDTCVAGTCVSASVSCPAGPCENVICNPAQGCKQLPPKPEGTLCGSAAEATSCTKSMCSDHGTCNPPALYVCASPNPCFPISCFSGYCRTLTKCSNTPCVDQGCDIHGNCFNTYIHPDGTSCGGGRCNPKTCTNGVCSEGGGGSCGSC